MRIGRSTKKSRQRERFILALLQQPTLDKAAEVAGISPTTAWRITKTPEFKAEYRIARRESYSQSIARLQQASTAAVSILLKIMVDTNAPTGLRLKAAIHALCLAAKGIEVEDIEARVSELEKAAETTKLGPNRR